jgi:UMF1 family MFS transporter
VNDRREIFGWMMYDWANSAFSTTVAGALLMPYLTSLAQADVGDNGVVLSLGPLGVLTAKSFFSVSTAASVILQAMFLPILGALADYSDLKKRLLAAFCYVGATATCLLFFITGDSYRLGAYLFIVANLSFGASIVMYNAFLREICSPDQTDKVSSRGYALGYLGGGVLLALNFLLLLGAPTLGITSGLAVRISLLSAGLWWAGFAIITFARLKPRASVRPLPQGHTLLTVGFSELKQTFRQLAKLPHTLRFLIAYLFYNDGIQTVVVQASVFLSQELFTVSQRNAGEDVTFVLKIFLMIQFVAFFGALLFERIAALAGTKKAILISLVLWAGVVVYAYRFLHTTTQALGMGVVIAIVLGGSQALSRSLFARMIPAGFEASFFGLYEVSERGTSWIGPLLFGLVAGSTGSFREAILSVIVLFVAGIIILALTDTDRAIREASRSVATSATDRL